MTVAKHVTRGFALGCLALSLTLVTASAQNFENYHILNNGTDAFYTNIGAGSLTGGTTTLYNAPSDGIGTWIPGEELRGPSKTSFFTPPDYGYGIRGFREFVCFLGAPPFNWQTGTNHIRFPLGLMYELDGSATWHGNNPGIFLAPTDPACVGPPALGTSFTGSATWIPYGATKVSTTAALGSVSWVLSALPSAIINSGVPSSLANSTVVLLPNEGLAIPLTSPSAGTANLFAAFSADLDVANTGQTCWGIQFSFVTSGGVLGTSAWLPDDITGFWHWLFFSPDGSQGYGWSIDEMALFQTSSVWMVSDGVNNKFTIPFIAGTDYSFLLVAMNVVTGLTLDPMALSGPGPYTFQTENVVANPNSGFDAGRGTHAMSFAGTTPLGRGVLNSAGVTNQDAAGNAATNPFWIAHTFGFMTWDSNGAGPGSTRVTMVSIDLDGTISLDPAFATDVEFPAGSGKRLPAPFYVVPSPYFQGITTSLMPLFGHTAAVAPINGWPDPDGFSVGAFGVPPIAGASLQLFMAPTPVCFPSVPLALSYGSIDSVFTNQGIISTSGLRETFLFN